MPTQIYGPGSDSLDLTGVSNLSIKIRSADESGPGGGEGGYAEFFIADPTSLGDTSIAIAVSAANGLGFTGLTWDVSTFVIRLNDAGNFVVGSGMGGTIDTDDWGAVTLDTPGGNGVIAGAGADGEIILEWDGGSPPASSGISKYTKLRILGII
jgi:hypothetical protein